MKKAFILLTAMALTATAFGVEVGKPAPDFTGTDINGKTVKLSDYKGKIVVLESYNSDCPFCANHYKTGAMPELERDMAAKGSAEVRQATSIIKGDALHYDQDTDMADAYGHVHVFGSGPLFVGPFFVVDSFSFQRG